MTTRGFAVLIGVLLMAGGCEQRTPEMQFVHDVGEAMGGEDNVAEAETLLLEGEGRQFRLGQASAPGDDLPYWELDEYRREFDLVNNRWRTIQTRSSSFVTGNPVLRQQQTFGIDGETAYTIAEDGTVRRAPAETAGQRIAAYYHHPVTLLQLALEEGSTVDNLRQDGGQDAIDITSAGGETFTMYVDPTTKHPTRITSMAYDPTLGDVVATTRFDDYWETGGLGGFQARLTMPRQIIAMTDEFTTWELRVTTSTDQALDDLSAPESARSAPPPAYVADVRVEEVGDGLWVLGGQSHHSVLIEFDEFLALVEAPQHDGRTLAVIAKARELQPDKPLQYVVNTHHHFDHSGGIRAAVSEGLTVIAHRRNEDFYRNLVSRPHTLRQDALAKSPQELSLDLVGNEVYGLGSGRRTMEIVRIRLDRHADALLVAYLPRERILIQADAYTPNARVSPFARDLVQAIEEREWRVDRIVPLHGDVVDMAMLEEAAEQEATRY